MAKDGFLVENLGRSYPFILQDETGTGKGSGTMPLPENSLTDLSILISPLVAFDPINDVITLSAVSRLGDGSFQFTISCTSIDLISHDLVFAVPAAAGRFEVFFTSNNLWEGYLTVGDMATIILQMSVSTSLTPGAHPPIVEPGVVVYNASSVRQVLLANIDRTRHAPPAGCAGSSSSSSNSSYPTGTVIPRVASFTGNVNFVDGYNASARQTAKAIVIDAKVGAGAGEPCSDVPVYDGEDPPDGASTLDGGDRCSEIISSINGLTGRNIFVQTGQGVRVYPGEDNQLVVDVDLSGMAVCQNDASISTSSSSSKGG